MKKLLSSVLITALAMYFCAPALAKNHDDYLKLNKNANHMHSRLSKEYTGYIYTLENISSTPVEILSVSLENTLTGEAAYRSVKRSSLAAGAKTIGTGLAYALPTLTLSLWGSILAAPVAMIGNSFGNAGAKQEGKRYDVPAQTKTLPPNSEIKFRTIAVTHHPPKVKILYKISGAEDLMTFEYK